MKAQLIKTDNSFFVEKVSLREDLINSMDKSTIHILECYSGNSLMYEDIKSRSAKTLDVTRIEKKKDCRGVYLQGDNIKYLKKLDLSKYDIIDLDAYGIPFDQLKILFNRGYRGFVIVTAIQSVIGRINYGLLAEIGYPKSMVVKCTTLFSRNGFRKLSAWLYEMGARSVSGYFIGRKNYFLFEIK